MIKSVLSQQEKSIYELKKKNDTLNKTIEVMEFRSDYMEEQIEPKENEIQELKEQMLEVGHVLLHMCHVSSLQAAMFYSALSAWATSFCALYCCIVKHKK